ncbi:MAG: LamG domain-containing protein, partial [Planctomycetota bacterium]
ADGAYASSITEAVSFACWFRLDDSVQDLTDRPWLVEFTGTTGGELWVSTNSDDLRLQVFAASGVAEKAHGDDLDLAPGSWHQAVGVYDGAEARIYLDGQLYTTLTDTDGIAPPTGQLRIGRNLIGGMDDVMVYNRVMTDAEIAEHYGLIGHWKFDESSGTTIADATLMGNDATFYTGDPAWGSGQVDGAIEFDGGDDAQTDNVFDPPATGTVAFWFRPQNSFTTSERLLGLGDDWEVRADSYGYLVFDLGATAVYEFETDDYASSAASWHHIVAMFDADADTYELYGDGTLLTSGSLSIAKQAAGYLSFGTTTGSTERFSGALDDVRVYNRWISAEEISALSGGTTSSGLRIMQWVEVR